jgi:hypothetical protein
MTHNLVAPLQGFRLWVRSNVTQGDALGWFVVALSGRRPNSLPSRRTFRPAGVLVFPLVVVLAGHARQSSNACLDAARFAFRPEGAVTHQPRATPWESALDKKIPSPERAQQDRSGSASRPLMNDRIHRPEGIRRSSMMR